MTRDRSPIWIGLALLWLGYGMATAGASADDADLCSPVAHRFRRRHYSAGGAHYSMHRGTAVMRDRSPIWIGLALLWLGCGMVTAGASNAYLQYNFCRALPNNIRSNLMFSIGWGAVMGPVGLVLSPFMGDVFGSPRHGMWRHGWSLSTNCEFNRGIGAAL